MLLRTVPETRYRLTDAPVWYILHSEPEGPDPGFQLKQDTLEILATDSANGRTNPGNYRLFHPQLLVRGQQPDCFLQSFAPGFRALGVQQP